MHILQDQKGSDIINTKELQDYRREYNKEVYKTVKVYIREEEYPQIIEHMKKQGYKKLSGYIKDLIAKDMHPQEAATSIQVQNNNGVIMRDNHGTVKL